MGPIRVVCLTAAFVALSSVGSLVSCRPDEFSLPALIEEPAEEPKAAAAAPSLVEKREDPAKGAGEERKDLVEPMKVPETPLNSKDDRPATPESSSQVEADPARPEPKADSPSSTTSQVTSTNPPQEPNKNGDKANGSEQDEIAGKAAPAPAPALSPAHAERDINALLANKDDAENDLAVLPVKRILGNQEESQPAAAVGTLAVAADSPKPIIVTEVNLSENKSSSSALDLDSPVEVNNKKAIESNSENNERFHYSLAGGSQAQADAPASGGSQRADANNAPDKTTTDTLSTTTVQKPVESSASEQPPSTTEPASSTLAPVTPSAADLPPPEKQPKPAAEAAASSARKPEDELQAKKEQEESRKEIVAEAKKSEAPIEAKKDQEEVVKVEVAAKSDLPKVEQANKTVEAEPKEEVTSSIPKRGEPERKELQTSTTGAPSSSTMAKADLPPVAAAGSALAGAGTPLAKSRPPTPTTKSPFSLRGQPLSPTPRRSTTSNWDKWPASPTSNAPSNRRRPILPSIRRRFRPHSRFPWSVDSYSPGVYGANEEPFSGFFEPTFSPHRKSSSSTTARPNRHHGTRSESSTRSPSASAADADSSEEAEEEEHSSPNGRRRGSGPNRRRHHHHHHHHHHNSDRLQPKRHQHSFGQRHFGAGEGVPSFPADDPFVGGSAEDAERPSFASNAGGFGLFNSAPTATGFDLLNPFSWIAPGGSAGSDSTRPAATGRNNNRGQGSTARGSGRPGSSFEAPERDRDSPHGYGHDYDNHHDHDHHHSRDCHDNDYDHNHHEHHRGDHHGHSGYGRPHGRPDRDREPYRPYAPVTEHHNPYPASRPARPHNRRDSGGAHSEHSSSDSNTIVKEADLTPTRPQPDRRSSPAESSATRRGPSFFSPFESLFKDIDEEIFSLRSSIFEPIPAMRQQKPIPTHHLDTVVSSPKISLPTASSSPAAYKEEDVGTGSEWDSKKEKEDTIDITRRARTIG